MKNKVTVIGAFIGIYLVFILASIPASFVINTISLPKNVSIHGVSGTAWSSSIKQIIVDDIVIEKVTGKLSVLSLITMSPSIDLIFGQSSSSTLNGKLSLQLSSEAININNVTVNIAANEIAPYFPAPLPIEAFGQVAIELAALSYSKQGCASAQGIVTWQRAAISALDEVAELGNLDAQIGCEKNNILLIINPKNNLGLTFTANFRPNGKITGQGHLLPTNNFPQSLSPVLSFLGRKDAQGRYRLRF